MQPGDPLTTSYDQYIKAKDPASLRAVVQHLRPTIEYTLGGLNASNDPVVRSRALVVTANAVSKFDPKNVSGATLPTFVSSELRQLTRLARQQKMPIKVPDRVILDSYKLNMAVRKFDDEHGREPDTLELADATGLSPKRISKVRTYQVTVPTEGAAGDLAAEAPDYFKDALDYVYNGADHTDRRILEMKTGYGGAEVLPPIAIAKRLNLTPSTLSRRSTRLTLQLNKIRDQLEKIS